jgi:hypothetical protein
MRKGRPLRIRCVGRRAFPRDLAAAAPDYFDFVDGDPDLLVLEHLGPPSSERTRIDLGPSFEALECGLPTVLFHTLDSWDWSEPWDDLARELCARVTLLFGTELSAGPIGGARVVPLLCPPSREPPPPREPAEIDLFFSGWYWPVGHTEPKPPGLPQAVWEDPREEWQVRGARHKSDWLAVLRERGEAIARLEDGLRGYDTVIEGCASWFATPAQRTRMSDAYHAALSRARVVFAPPGRGCSTQRLTDAWAHGCLVLSPQLTDRVRMPEAAAWMEETHHVRYRWDLSDLVERAREALEREPELRGRAAAGRDHYLRAGPLEAQMRRVFGAMEEMVTR